MAISTITDHYTGWIKQSFMLPQGTMTRVDRYYRELTTADFKYTDTRLGGNFCINNVPQYTQYADIRHPGRLTRNRNGNIHNPRGLGRFYSEQIDDNNLLVHMQFGVPAYNGMVTFFTGFYNNDAARVARTGKSFSIFYTIGKVAGFVASLYAWPFIVVGHVARFLSDAPASKYYYFKQTMVSYWNRVNTVVNTLAVNMGLVSRLYQFDEKITPYGEKNPDTKRELTRSDQEIFYKLAPDIFNQNGSIDIYAVANRAQRLANKQLEDLERLANNDASLNSFGTGNVSDIPSRGIEQATEAELNTELGKPTGVQNNDFVSAANAENRQLPEDTAAYRADYITPEDKRGTWSIFRKIGSNAWNNLIADMRDGSTHVTFKVDFTGSVEESFSNSVRESAISSTINGVVSTGASARFSTSDGQTGIGLADMAIGAARDFVSGALDSISLSGLMALSGTAFVDFPKHWESSTATFSRSSYTIELRSPYGNTMSRFQNLYVPLAMLLAAALPISTGKQSYTSPYILQLFCKGRNTIRLGMIDSMSITRGTGNMGWTNDGHPLGIDVSFSVVDLSTVLHMPIAANYSILNPLDGVFDSDSNWNDYMATLSSLSLAEQIYRGRKIVRALTLRLTQFQSNFSTAKLSNTLFNSQIGQAINFLADSGQRTLGN